MTDKEFDEMCYVIGVGQCLLNIATNEEWRKSVFNRVSKYLAKALQIEPLEYTKERAHNFVEEMSTHISTSLLKKKGDKNERLEQSNCKTVQNDGDQKKI